jgi:hypothetical protein
MRDYPRWSQMNESNNWTLILVRLYDISYKTNYWLSEYDQKTKTAYGYITTPSWEHNQWAEIPIYELECLTIFGFEKVHIDDFFIPKKFRDLPFNKKKDS